MSIKQDINFLSHDFINHHKLLHGCHVYLLEYSHSGMTTEIKHYKDLTKEEFHDMIALRISVFVVEQDCPYQELDGLDKDAYHVLIKENQEIIATARILKAGVAYQEIAIGRVVSAINHRKSKLGHSLMEACMSFIEKKLNNAPVRLSAQSHLKGYYEKYGFIPTGKDYLEDGIPHSEMLFTAGH